MKGYSRVRAFARRALAGRTLARRSPAGRSPPCRTLAHGTVAIAICALAACGDGEAGPDTQATSMDLLGSRPAPGEPTSASGVPIAQPGVAPGQERPIDVAMLGFDRGVAGAPVRVVEMSDYSCGVCRQFHESVWPKIYDQFIATGKIQWKFLPFVSGQFPNSPVASEGAECTLEQDPDLFLRHHGILWSEQASWKTGSDPETFVRASAERSGADMEQWDACMSSDRRRDRILAGTALARQLGVRGTPTFFVLGYPPIQGLLPTETFLQVLGAAVEDAAAATGG